MSKLEWSGPSENHTEGKYTCACCEQTVQAHVQFSLLIFYE